MNNYIEKIDYDYYQKNCGISDIESAVNTIFAANESQIEKIKQEKWYNRLINCITFSRKNELRMAGQISSLAQAQQILLELLSQLSAQDAQVITFVSQNIQSIRKLSENDLYLQERLFQLEKTVLLGIRRINDVRNLTATEKSVLIVCLKELCRLYDYPNLEQQQYARNTIDYLGFNAEGDIKCGDVLSNVQASSRQIMLECCLEYIFLDELSFDYEKDVSDFVDNFDLGSKTIARLKQQVKSLYDLCGVEGLINKYWRVASDSEFSIRPEENDNRENENVVYLHVQEKENIEISYECAQVYFQDCINYDKDKAYIESSSYIIYNEGNKIIKLHKSLCSKEVLFDNMDDASGFVKKKKIATYSDIAYYVLENDLWYVNLETNEKGFIFHIEEEYRTVDGVKEKYEITDLSIYNSEKIVYRSRRFNVIDIEQGPSSAKSFSLGAMYGYVHHDCYLYFIYSAYDGDFSTEKYVLKKHNLLTNQTTTVSKYLGEHKDKGKKVLYQLVTQGVHNGWFYCVFQYDSRKSMDPRGFDGFRVRIHGNGATDVRKFYIAGKRIYQFEQYQGRLIYINADKDYSLISHDCLADSKRTLRKKCGETEKATAIDKWSMWKGFFQHPYPYMRLGKWIWIKDKKKWKGDILSID